MKVKFQAQRDWNKDSLYRIILVVGSKQEEVITDYVYHKGNCIAMCESLNKLANKQTEFYEDLDEYLTANKLNRIIKQYF